MDLPSPPPKSPSLHTLVIHLGVAEDSFLPAACGRAIHAQVLAWFQLANPEISEAIHKTQNSPLCLSNLIPALGNRPRKSVVRAGDEFYFRVGLLDGNLLEPLLEGLELWADRSFSLGKCPFVFRSVHMLPGTDPWAGSSTYALLTKTPTIFEDLEFKLLSPTSFKVNTGQDIQPFPLPESVFGSLHRRWNGFAPEELQFPKIAWQGIVTDFELKTQRFKMENSWELGAVGRVRYRFPDSEQARVATILAHFAFFAGVGRKTTMGMGQVVLDNRK